MVVIRMVTEQIVPLKGVTQCVERPTRWPQGLQEGVPVTIDHHWTTAPEKLSVFSLFHMGSSDHVLLSVVRYTRCAKGNQPYVTKQSYRNFDSKGFLDEIVLIQWRDVYKCDTVNEGVKTCVETCVQYP